MGIHTPKTQSAGQKFDSGAVQDLTGVTSIIRIQVKTANYTVKESDSGTTFTTYGDGGAITFTLPTNAKKGSWYRFIQSVDQSLTVTNGTADELITYNDTQADGLACSTGSHKVGAVIEVVCDGNRFHAWVTSGNTKTVNT